jgi:hypothetical protein
MFSFLCILLMALISYVSCYANANLRYFYATTTLSFSDAGRELLVVHPTVHARWLRSASLHGGL